MTGVDETTVGEIRSWFDLPDLVLLVAERPDGEIVGYADSADEDEHTRFPFDLRVPPTSWINVLGVRRPWRRRGVARALLLHAFAEFRGRGKRGAGLGVDGLNTTGAVRLYEQAGMHVARRYDQYKKPLSA